MRGFVARAVPWEHGWELHIEGHGVTQVRVLDKAAQQVRDYVSTVTDTDVPDTVPVTLHYDLGGLEQDVADARSATGEAERLQLAAAAANRTVVAGLRAKGISVSDIAAIMDVSRGRVSQLLAAGGGIQVKVYEGRRMPAPSGRTRGALTGDRAAR